MPIKTITPIPDTAPAAVPELWNSRFREIDDNFTDIQKTQEKEALVGYVQETTFLEQWVDGETLTRSGETDVTLAVFGDNTVDVVDTSWLIVGEEYVIWDSTHVEIIKVLQILTSTRFLTNTNLTYSYGSGAKVSFASVTVVNGVASLPDGGAVYTKDIDFGEDPNYYRTLIIHTNHPLSVYVMRQGEVSWSSVVNTWTSSVKDGGYYDYGYLIHSDGSFRLKIVNASGVAASIAWYLISNEQVLRGRKQDVIVHDLYNMPADDVFLDIKLANTTRVSITSVVINGKEYEIGRGTYILPAGIVVFSKTVQSDATKFTRFTDADDVLLGCIGSTFSAGKHTNSISISTMVTGNHSAWSHAAVPSSSDHWSGIWWGGSEGDHSHIISGYLKPKRIKQLIYIVVANQTYFPNIGFLFYGATPDGFIRDTSAEYPVYLSSGDANTISNMEVQNFTVASAGSHVHSGSSPVSLEHSTNNRAAVSGGSHDHVIASYDTPEVTLPYCKLSLIYAQEDYLLNQIPLHSIAIVLEVSSIPPGWHLCNGESGTLDLTDKFILVDNTGDGSIVLSSMQYRIPNIVLAQDSFTHSHIGETSGALSTSGGNGNYGTYSLPHTHTPVGSDSLASFTPCYYGVYFIEYIGE